MNFERRESNEVYEQEFSWENDLGNIDRAGAITKEELSKLGWPEDQADAFSLAVHEAVANAVLHGNLGVNMSDGEAGYRDRIKDAQEKNKEKRVKIYFRFSKEDATAQIKDEGDFVPEGIIDPTTGERLLKGSGRGALIIESAVDNLTFSPGEIIIHKQRKENEDAIE